MRVTVAEFRKNVNAILDQVAETGVPVEVESKGQVLRIEVKKSLRERFPKRDLINRRSCGSRSDRGLWGMAWAADPRPRGA
jgi:hypothetical protein